MPDQIPVPNSEILVPISPGELLDKITILEIKAERIEDADKNANVRRELAALQSVAASALPGDETLSVLKGQLLAINTTLWDVEDALRDLEREKCFDGRFIELARKVYVTNDQRAAVKKQINLLLGSDLVEEKSYKAY
ncbi:MAG: DUF6165 family protein [Neomegalonema sp.]|nr:DUF6165 family protein [Neomegalonema sp.]